MITRPRECATTGRKRRCPRATRTEQERSEQVDALRVVRRRQTRLLAANRWVVLQKPRVDNRLGRPRGHF